MSIKALIFDMDGTLWDSAEKVAESWTVVLKKRGLDKVITTEDIQGVMGLPMDKIADKLFAEYPEEERMDILDECGNYENEYLRENGGVLYPYLEETFAKLIENYELYIVSNCQSGYIEAFLDHYDFWKYINDILCWGDTKVSKGESIKILMEKNGLSTEETAYVGDIQGDCDSAHFAGIRFIHAAYGFGEVVDKDESIEAFTELLELVPTM